MNFDLYIKFLLVEGVWWLFFMLSLLPDMAALTWISRVFDVVHGPLVFCVAMCRTRVAFLFKKYFCHDGCCFGCCSGGGEFIDEADGGGVCQELSVIDRSNKLTLLYYINNNTYNYTIITTGSGRRSIRRRTTTMERRGSRPGSPPRS